MARKTTKEETQLWLKNTVIYTVRADFGHYCATQTYVAARNSKNDPIEHAKADYPGAKTYTLLATSTKVKII